MLFVSKNNWFQPGLWSWSPEAEQKNLNGVVEPEPEI